ncbi:hypothetical protein ANO11243_097230 [Dothideomycetidae sp. 11243]|nr:hypothetical protein ANO11243_097230 [fungal sp. No.11243]
MEPSTAEQLQGMLHAKTERVFLGRACLYFRQINLLGPQAIFDDKKLRPLMTKLKSGCGNRIEMQNHIDATISTSQWALIPEGAKVQRHSLENITEVVDRLQAQSYASSVVDITILHGAHRLEAARLVHGDDFFWLFHLYADGEHATQYLSSGADLRSPSRPRRVCQARLANSDAHEQQNPLGQNSAPGRHRAHRRQTDDRASGEGQSRQRASQQIEPVAQRPTMVVIPRLAHRF